MIHILTVHWKDDRWIDIQLKYLKRHIKMPYKVYAFLNDLPGDHRDKYFYSSTENIKSHAIKLNFLADMATLHSVNPDDWLMFIDGDAFPIGNIVTFVSRHIDNYPLLAIQRKENIGDKQPHPSFCVTTVKFWNEINGDWKAGYSWKNSEGEMVTDVGGNLLEKLEKANVEWYPMLRSNKNEMHDLWFGVYEKMIYHHGAGFRNTVSRIDLRDKRYLPSISFKNKILNTLYDYCRKAEKKVIKKTVDKKNNALSEKVYQNILSDTKFYLLFQDN